MQLSPPPAKGILKKSTVVGPGPGAGTGAGAAVSMAAPAAAKKNRRAENDGHAANMTRARMPSAAAGAGAGAGTMSTAGTTGTAGVRSRPHQGAVAADHTPRGHVMQMIARRESLPGHGKPLTPVATTAAATTAPMVRTPVVPRQAASSERAVKAAVANPFSFAEG